MGWYQTLFNDLLPDATFSLSSSQAGSSTCHFTWRATSDGGNVNDGNDTLGVLNGKIVYHYTQFSVS